MDSLLQRKQAFVGKHGPWSAHNIFIRDDVYTIDRRVVCDEVRLKRIMQIVSDFCAKPIDQLRVLDLGFMEGLFAIEFARRGARVVGIEGRDVNIARTKFVKDELSLGNLELVQDDVRNLSKEKHGTFDVILCLGLIYHIDVPDVFRFIEKISECCSRLAIFDTHVSVSPKESVDDGGKRYWGRYYSEHQADAVVAQKARTAWSSLDNPRSFWFTRASLYNLLSHVGFSSVHECQNPSELTRPFDRVLLTAVKGEAQSVLSAPLLNSIPATDWPEKRDKNIAQCQRWYFPFVGAISRWIPASLRRKSNP
jgi:hypothetical protein